VKDRACADETSGLRAVSLLSTSSVPNFSNQDINDAMSGSAHPAEQAEGEGTPLRGSHPNNARNTHLNGSGSRAWSDLATGTLQALRGCLRVGPSSSGKHRSTYARVDDDESSNGLPGYEQANIFSRTIFGFVTTLLRQGARRQLSADDLFPTPTDFNAADAADAIERPLFDELEHSGGEASRRIPVVALALWRSFKRAFLRTAGLKLLNDIVGALPPLIMGALLSLLSDEPNKSRVKLIKADSDSAGYLLALLMFLVPVCKTLIEQQYFYRAQLLNTGFKTGITAVVFRKAMRLSAASKQGTSSGEIMNHMQLDAFKVGDLMTYFNVLWSGMVQIALYLGLIYLYIGYAAFGGFTALLIIIPIQLWAFRSINAMRDKQMHHADQRVKQQNEVLNGIKIIKLNAWEQPVGKQALDQRSEEVKWLRRVAIVQGFVTALMWTAPVIVALCAFTIYSIGMGGEMTASRVFPSLVLFNQLRFPMIFYPRVLNQIADALVALRRLGRFVSLEESEPNAPVKERDIPELRIGDEVVQCTHSSFHFCKPDYEDSSDNGNSSSTKRFPFLENLNITLKMGELTCIVGSVGSGKTSIALALLGELHQCSGEPVRVHGRVAYASQSAWIQNGTIRENILFGSEMNRALYDEVLRVTCLKDDVASLRDGDATEIGEKGVTLSGGQKQRVALARAAYADADVYFLDDPLSALDASVGKHVFDELICGMLNEKCVLLTTHALHLLDKANDVLVVDNGSIVDEGTYEDLVQRKHQDQAFAQLAEKHGNVSSNLDERNEEDGDGSGEEGERADQQIDKRSLRRARSSSRIMAFVSKERSGNGDDTAEPSSERAGSSDKGADEEERLLSTENAGLDHQCTRGAHSAGTQKGRQIAPRPKDEKGEKKQSEGLVKEESREEGTVRLGVYLSYLRAYPGGYAMATLVLFIVILRQIGSVGQMYWLSVWSEGLFDARGWEALDYLTVYGLIAAGVGVVTYCSSISFWLCGLTAARKLHLKLFHSIVAARMRFFDETPHGRILQRFQKDTDVLDNLVPQTLSTVAQFVIQLSCILLIMSYVQPVLTPFFFPIGALYWTVQRFFRASYREIKRLDAVLASPVYAHFSESLDGLTTVRAFGRQKDFKGENMRRVLENQRAFYAQRCCCDRWLPVRLETIGNSLVLITGVIGVAIHDTETRALKTYTSLIGLLLTYSLEITSLMNWIVRQWSELESHMVSMERIKEYSTEVDPEERLEAKGMHLAEDHWPSKGDLKVEHLQLRYSADAPLALKDVSLHAPPGCKVGVVGRTGSGKSSLIAALWRLVESCGGRILIDGVDTSRLTLEQLRSRITCIPQDAVLFSGTIRYNLDPFEKRSDAELWDALESVQLKSEIDSLSNKVEEFGTNYSEGQKQLLCLARAMLRQSSFVALDEATASVRSWGLNPYLRCFITSAQLTVCLLR